MAKRKKIDLATAMVADAEVKSPTSLYEICGVRTSSYRTSNVEEYKASLAALNLIQLQDEAYQHAVPATQNREAIISRLVDKFILTVGRLGAKTAHEDGDEASAIRQQAKNIMARGR